MSKPSATESTYALVAASASAVGVASPVILLLETATVPVPVGTSVIELSAPVAVIVGAAPLTASVVTLPELVIPAVVRLAPVMFPDAVRVVLNVPDVAPVIAPELILAVPSVYVPPCIEPLNVAATPDVIEPLAILNVPSVTVAPCTVATAVMFVPASIVLEAFNAVVTFPDGAKLTIVISFARISAKAASVTVVPSPIPVVVPAWNSSADSFHTKTALFSSPRSPTNPKS